MAKRRMRAGVAQVLAAAGLVLAGGAAFAQSDWIRQLESGCDGGDGQDCANLGSQLRLGHVVEEDPVRARAAFEKGCKLDSTVACMELYMALSRGYGGAVDLARARQLEDRVCDTGIISLDVHLKANGFCTR